MQPLPIDQHLPRLVRALDEAHRLVLIAEPGAGKTTRVPPALLEAPFLAGGEIWVSQPRRLAARAAARRVADELGEPLGGRVGFHVRHEQVAGPRTRLRFVTEGVLLRRLMQDPALRGVSAVVLDELHERSLQADTALAWLCREQQPDSKPRLLVMSATLQAEPVARHLGCDVLHVEGRCFPVAIEHREQGADRPKPQRVAATLRRLLHEGLDGDVLVFLPGAAEIRAAKQACEAACREAAVELVTLHGDLPSAQQRRAIVPGPRPKVILATNIAETSLTIEGVTTVIDTGLARRASHSPWSGLPVLSTVPISRASAEQRAGRAGRVREGRCIRLYGASEHAARPAHDPPEIRNADLSDMLLAARAAGMDPAALHWLESPPERSLLAAEALLRRLQAFDEAGRSTDLGRRMAKLPLHPRLARLVEEARARGVPREGCLVAALLGERDIVPSARARAGERRDGDAGVAASDVSDRMERFEQVEAVGLRSARAHGLDEGAVRAVARARDQLWRQMGEPAVSELEADAREEALGLACLAAFGDRVARRRKRSDALLLAGGGSAKLSSESVVRDAPWVVVLDATQMPRGERMAHRVVAIEPEWLLELFPDRIHGREDHSFDAERERVVQTESLSYDDLILDQSSRAAPAGSETSRCLFAAVKSAGLNAICDVAALQRLRARVAFAARHDETLAPLTDAEVDAALQAMCEQAASFAELREQDLLQVLAARHAQAWSRLEHLAPERVAVGHRRGVPIRYEADRDPWIASRLQDFFGMREGPRLAGGRAPLVLHLLAPNKRAVQVTTDLARFWREHYPALRKQLMRRYPRHAWPDDPVSARPPSPGRSR